MRLFPSIQAGESAVLTLVPVRLMPLRLLRLCKELLSERPIWSWLVVVIFSKVGDGICC